MTAVIPILDVYLYGARVAELRDAGEGELALQYTQDALALGNRARLSLSLPVRREPYPSRRGGNRWVRSILPEPQLRDRLATEFGLDADDYSGMLLHVGRDVAGAAVIVPAGEAESLGTEDVERVTDDDVCDLIFRLPTNPLGVDRERGVRLSLAGAQEKLLMVRTPDGHWARPLNGYPSTSILKPEPDEYPGLATNELLALRLAALSGFDTAVAKIHTFGATRTLIVERYDRILSSGSVRRIHQEDLLSAAGRDPLHKYEYDDEHGHRGPTLRDLAATVASHLGLAQLARFLDVVAFNVIIGNADAHARNVSFLLHQDGSVGFSPLYDLICTRVYDGVSTDLSQRINGQHDIDTVTIDDLVAEAESWGLTNRLARRRVIDTFTRTSGALDAAARDTRTAGGDGSMVDSLHETIKDRADTLFE